MSEAVTVRRGVADDAAAIAGVHVAAWREEHRGLLPAHILQHVSMRQSCNGWRRVLSAAVTPRPVVVVATSDARVTGFVVVSASRDADANDDTGEVQAIYVDPQFWGGGIGGRLLQEGLKALRMCDFGVATLWVLSGNARAMRFYARRGWRFDGATRPQRIGAVTLTDLRLRRALTGGCAGPPTVHVPMSARSGTRLSADDVSPGA